MIDRAADMRHILSQVRLFTGETVVMEDTDQDPQYLYHGTTTRYLKGILGSGGLDGGSHWTSRPEIAQWFAKHKAKEKGGRQVLIRVPFAEFDPNGFQPDLNLMDFPIPAHETDHEDRLNALAEPSAPTWQESLRHFDAVIYDGMVPVGIEQCFDVKGRPLR
jgi:hypothetical protein